MSASSTESDTCSVSQTTLHEGWLYHKKSEHHDWVLVWGMLRADKFLFLFSSDKKGLENHISTIPLDKDTSFISDNNHKDMVQFKLQFAKKKDKFKFQVKVYDRELWRAYIVGLTTGSIPENVILSYQDKLMVEDKLRLARQGQHPTPTSSASAPSLQSYYNHPHQPQPQHSSSDNRSLSCTEQPSDSQGRAGTQPPYHSVSEGYLHDSTGSSGSSGSLPSVLTLDRLPKDHRPSVRSKGSHGSSNSGENEPRFRVPHSDYRDSGVQEDYLDGGPFMIHKFTRGNDGTVPSWFIGDCSRDLADKILIQSRQFGNTLMRVSSTARSTGSYVISNCSALANGELATNHYEVARVAEGYQLKVENCTTPFKTLSEVMECFVELVGKQRTRLLTTNSLDLLLGQDHGAPYSQRITPESNPAPASSSSDSDDEHFYEVPRDNFSASPSPAPGSRVDPAPMPAVSASASIPVAPPPPPMVPPTSAIQKGSMTLTRNKPGAASCKVQQYASSAKTLGHANISTPGKGRQSVQDLELQISETHAVRRLDLMLNDEEARSLSKATETPSAHQPPALPPVPMDRPKLALPDAASTGHGQPVPGGVPTSRWKQRSQSVPNVDVSGINANVCAIGGGLGAKILIDSEVFSTRVLRHVTFPDDSQVEDVKNDNTAPDVMNELQQKLQRRRLTLEEAEQNKLPEVLPDSNTYEDYSHYQNLS